MSLRCKLKRLKSLGYGEKRLLAETVFALLRARFLFTRLSTHALIQRLTRDRPAAEAPACVQELHRLSWAITAAANTLPWRTDCLIQCLAADLLLRRRNITGCFYIGVANSSEGALAAHAWMMHGNTPITGGDGADFEPLITPDTFVGRT